MRRGGDGTMRVKLPYGGESRRRVKRNVAKKGVTCKRRNVDFNATDQKRDRAAIVTSRF